jgi:hypothetical protein
MFYRMCGLLAFLKILCVYSTILTSSANFRCETVNPFLFAYASGILEDCQSPTSFTSNGVFTLTVCFLDTKELSNFSFIIFHLITARERASILSYKSYQIVVSNSKTNSHSLQKKTF